jgi:hypothetical protein
MNKFLIAPLLLGLTLTLPAQAGPRVDADNAAIAKFKKDHGPREKWSPVVESEFQELVGKRNGDAIRDAGTDVKHGAEWLGDKAEAAWDKLANATVKAAENLADAVHDIADAAKVEAKRVGHHVHNGFAKHQRHLDVVRRGNTVVVLQCNSKLFNGAAHLGLGKGEDCQTLHDGTMKISDLKSCMKADHDMPGAQPFARQLKGMDMKAKVAHEYFLTFEAGPADIQALLGSCQRRLASRAVPAPRSRPTPQPAPAPDSQPAAERPEFHPVDPGSGSQPANGGVDGEIGRQ